MQRRTVATFDDAPPWFDRALDHIGVTELLADKTLNPIVRGYFKHTRFPPSMISTKTSWCAAFVSSMLEQTGIRSARSAAAIDYERWGNEVEPTVGAVCVLSRSDESNPRARHVGFYAGKVGKSFLLLGGNQKNSVCIVIYPDTRFLTARWPDNR